MLENGKLYGIEKRVLIFVFILLLAALYTNLGIYPLTLEEPRRGLIALEMIFSDNWIVPTQNGELYFRKPPIYNWMLILSYKLFGNYSELATRFVSVTSFVLMGVVFFRFCKKHIGERFAAYTALSFLVSVDILFYFSALGEIDLFYSLLTLMVFITIYNFGEQKRYYSLFIIAYFLSALGFLTKGLPSIPFIGISLLVYFLLKRDFKRLFSIPHLVGGLVFLMIVGGYFWLYNQYEDPSGWRSTLLSESADRTGGSGILAFLKHIVNFPLDSLKNVLPATLFIPFMFRRDLISRIKRNPFILYLALIFAANMLLYWLSTGTRSRYVYALYPLIIGVFMYLFFDSKVKWKKKFLRILTIVVSILLALGPIAMNFFPQFQVIDNLIVISVAFCVAALIMLVLVLKFEKLRLAMLILLFVIMRIGYSLTMPVIRVESSGASLDKQYGLEIAEIAANTPVYLYQDTDISRAITFYIEAEKEEILRRGQVMDGSGYWICDAEDLDELDVQIIKTFVSRTQKMYLVKRN